MKNIISPAATETVELVIWIYPFNYKCIYNLLIYLSWHPIWNRVPQQATLPQTRSFALQQMGNLGLIYVHRLPMPQVYFEGYGVIWVMGRRASLGVLIMYMCTLLNLLYHM